MASLSWAWVPGSGDGSILDRIERKRVMCDRRVVKRAGWAERIETA